MKKPAQVTQAQQALKKAKAAAAKARATLEAAQKADFAASQALSDAQHVFSRLPSYFPEYYRVDPEAFNPYQ